MGKLGHLYTQSRRSAGLLVIAVLAMTSWTSRAAPAEIVIGVISPTNSGRAIGEAHEETIRFAFQRLGPTIGADGIAMPYRVEYVSDGGDPTLAVTRARELVAAGAIAILGPVDSGSTEAVLKAGLEVPVLSALSTAPALSKPRDPWFFRLTMDDAERIRHYLRSLKREESQMMPAPRLVLYDDASPYGLGLRDALIEAMGLDESDSLAWSELIAGGAVRDDNREELRAGRGFTPGGEARLQAVPATVFLFGTNRNAVAIAQGIDAWVHGRAGAAAPRMLFVGDDSDLKAGAPEGSITIGEPAIVEANGSGAAALRSEFSRERRRSADDFLVTAYEAARYVLPQAIAQVVRTAASASVRTEAPDSPGRLRERLRTELERGEFQSSEPWRFIRVRGGALEGAPAVPVYRIARRFVVWDVADPRPWLDVEAPERAGYLEGPVAIRVRGHGLTGDLELSVVRVDGSILKDVDSETRPLADGRSEVSFYPSYPGRYQLRVSLPTNPPKPVTEVAVRMGYPIGLAGAVVGSLVFVVAVTERGGRCSRRRIALGVLTGLVLVTLVFHRTMLPEILPIPLLGDSDWLNAFWAGFAGGWFGPGILMLALGRIAPRLPGGASPRDAPTDGGAPAPLSST